MATATATALPSACPGVAGAAGVSKASYLNRLFSWGEARVASSLAVKEPWGSAKERVPKNA